MAAYAALLSLNFTIDQIPRSIIPDKYHIESLKEKISFLLGFFEDYYQNEDLAFERAVVDNAYAIDFFLEWHASNQMLIESGYSGENNSELFPEENIQLVMQEFDSIKDYAMQIMDFKVNDESQMSTSHLPNGPSLSASSVENTMVGFDEHLIRIMDVITRPGSAKLQILPVVGMGGIGKTTLARNVFDNKLMNDRFDIRLWGEVSQSCDVQNILLGFLRDIGIVDDQINLESNNELSDKLYRTLKSRRYFIVIDNIWSVEAWDTIRRFFPDDGNESRIIITTRLLDVASHIGSCDPYKLELLNDYESWNLLKEKVFAQDGCPAALENTGRKIAVRCGGLPLAIVVIAGQLAKSDMTIDSWENVAGAINSIVNSENDNQCLNILSLSYDNLPAFLKPCFLYMGIFPEDLTFSVSRLITCWVAEGFLKPTRDKCLEDTALEYLTYLVERNLVSVSARGSSGKIKRCRVHDLLRDLCLRKAHEHNFLYSRTMLRYGHGFPRSTETMSHINKFRTSKDKTDYPSNLLSMRVRGFEFCTFEMASRWDFGPHENLQLFRLRHICLLHDRVMDILTLSSSLASLSMFQNLQTLIMNEVPGNEPVVLPSQVWEMSHIRHLLIQRVVLLDPPVAESHVNGKEICVLKNMRTLLVAHNFKLSEEVIKRIPNLKKLNITYTKVSESVEWPSYHLYNLVKLYKLESLSCSMYKTISTADISFPLSLKKLTLDGGNIPWKDMTMVGSLPNLEVLRLQNDAFYGTEWTPNEGEFCQLRALHFRNISLEHWEADETHFPRLERLIFYNVWRMKEIPLGIGTNLDLISLELCSMSLYNSVSRLKQEAEESSGVFDGIEFNAPMKEIMERMPFFLSGLLPNPNQVQNLEYDLRQLNAFLRYTTKNGTKDKRLKILVSHIRDVMHEAREICKDITMQLHNGDTLMSYSYTRFLYIIKEIEHVNVRAQRLLLTVADGSPQKENEDRMLDKEPVKLINITNGDKAVSSRVGHIFRDFARLTVVDGSPDGDEAYQSYLDAAAEATSKARAIIELLTILEEQQAYVVLFP